MREYSGSPDSQAIDLEEKRMTKTNAGVYLIRRDVHFFFSLSPTPISALSPTQIWEKKHLSQTDLNLFEFCILVQLVYIKMSI